MPARGMLMMGKNHFHLSRSQRDCGTEIASASWVDDVPFEGLELHHGRSLSDA